MALSTIQLIETHRYIKSVLPTGVSRLNISTPSLFDTKSVFITMPLVWFSLKDALELRVH